MAHDSQKAVGLGAIESLYRSLFALDSGRADHARTVAGLALTRIREGLQVDDTAAATLRTALGWVAFDYANKGKVVGPEYLAHAIKWRADNRRPGLGTLGDDFGADVIEMRADGLLPPSDERFEESGAGHEFMSRYEEAVGAQVFGPGADYGDYIIGTR